MSTLILIRKDARTGESVRILADTARIYPLADEIADQLQETHPEIYETAFVTACMGEIYINRLSPEEFRIVYEVTKEKYDLLMEQVASGAAADPLSVTTWHEYLEALASDPRLAGLS